MTPSDTLGAQVTADRLAHIIADCLATLRFRPDVLSSHEREQYEEALQESAKAYDRLQLVLADIQDNVFPFYEEINPSAP